MGTYSTLGTLWPPCSISRNRQLCSTLRWKSNHIFVTVLDSVVLYRLKTFTCRLSLGAASEGSSLCAGLSAQWLLLLWSMGCRCAGFSSCSPWAQLLWLEGLVAPQHVGSSQTREQTSVPCIGRWILNHWTSREALPKMFLILAGFVLLPLISLAIKYLTWPTGWRLCPWGRGWPSQDPSPSPGQLTPFAQTWPLTLRPREQCPQKINVSWD